MQPVIIQERAYWLEQREGPGGAYSLTLWEQRKLRGWRGWLGGVQQFEAATLEISPKGRDDTLCQLFQGLFALTQLHVNAAWQGRGLGSYLLREGMRHARKHGMVLAGELRAQDSDRLWHWFMHRGLDVVQHPDQPGRLWVLGRKAKTAPSEVTMTRLVLPESA